MSDYSDRLDEICDIIDAAPDTHGAAALKKVILDLEGDGPIGGIMFSLDAENFKRAINLLVEFRRTGRGESFNSLHAAARRRVTRSDSLAPKGM